MQEKVVIFLQNKNALVSMALISQNHENPFKVFCEYIRYCISINDKSSFMVSDIRELVEKEFDVRLPMNIIISCLDLLGAEGFIKQDKGSIIQLVVYNTEEFDSARIHYRETEEKLISALTEYANSNNKDWTKEYSKEQLIKVLDNNGLAFDIFSRKDIENNPDSIVSILAEINSLESDDEDEIEESERQIDDEEDNIPIFSDKNIVGRFISKTLKEKSLLTDYLTKVCEGMMICAGTYLLPSSEIKTNNLNIKGTSFFFDTRLLLRVLGCANKASVEAARELVQLIKQNGGLIYYFPHTSSEIQNAFDDAIIELKNKKSISDYEMMSYANSVKNPLVILQSKKDSFGSELLEYGIYLRPLGFFDEKERIQNSFEKIDMESFIRTKFHWKNDKTIENDVSSIWETHMLRNGDYSEYCGKLPVFVTTNVKLPLIALEYAKSRPGVRPIAQWKKNRLPVITDVRLTCRIWIPSEQSERISLLYLTANTVAALRPTRAYINKMRGVVEELVEKSPEYSNISLSEFLDDNISEMVFEKTQGDGASFQLSTLAETLEEKILLNDELHSKEMDKVNRELEENRNEFDQLKNSVIESAVYKSTKAITFTKFRMNLLYYHGWILSLVAFAVSAFVSVFCQTWYPAIIFVVILVLAILEKCIASKIFYKRFLNLFYPSIKRKHINYMKKNLTTAEERYEEEIIEGVLSNDKTIVKIEKQLR